MKNCDCPLSAHLSYDFKSQKQPGFTSFMKRNENRNT